MQHHDTGRHPLPLGLWIPICAQGRHKRLEHGRRIVPAPAQLAGNRHGEAWCCEPEMTTGVGLLDECPRHMLRARRIDVYDRALAHGYQRDACSTRFYTLHLHLLTK